MRKQLFFCGPRGDILKAQRGGDTLATTTANARQPAIRLSNRVRKDPDLAKKLGIRVDFKQQALNEHTSTEHRKDVKHES